MFCPLLRNALVELGGWRWDPGEAKRDRDMEFFAHRGTYGGTWSFSAYLSLAKRTEDSENFQGHTGHFTPCRPWLAGSSQRSSRHLPFTKTPRVKCSYYNIQKTSNLKTSSFSKTSWPFEISVLRSPRTSRANTCRNFSQHPFLKMDAVLEFDQCLCANCNWIKRAENHEDTSRPENRVRLAWKIRGARYENRNPRKTLMFLKIAEHTKNRAKR